MEGACPCELSVQISNAVAMGACGVLLMSPAEIVDCVKAFRAEGGKAIQLNNWVPDAPFARGAQAERAIAQFLRKYDPAMLATVELSSAPNFSSQCEAMLDSRPTAVSSIMGLYDRKFIDRLKSHGIAWLATVTTVDEAIEAQERGAYAIVAQGFEAGGHRDTFNPQRGRVDGRIVFAFTGNGRFP